MTTRDWKPGAVAMVTVDGIERPAVRSSDGTKWIVEPEPSASRRVSESARPLVVIDPEDREQVEALVKVVSRDTPRIVTGISQGDTEALNAVYVAHMQAALRRFANPAPEEPTDPAARVTDRRENVWRLLADGDWVCTSGPDIGEYLTWPGLTRRGPLTVEVQP